MRFRRATRAVLASLVCAALTALTLTPVAASGPDPSHCSPNDPRVSVPKDFVLDACFDGKTLLVLNRSGFPAFIEVSGDAIARRPSWFAGPATLTANALGVATRNALMPGFQAPFAIGDGAASVSVSFDAEVASTFRSADFIVNNLPSILAWPGVLAQYLSEVDNARRDLLACRVAVSSVWGATRCSVGFMWDMNFANTRVIANTVITALQLKQLVNALLAFYEKAWEVNSVLQDVNALVRKTPTLTVPARSGASASSRPPSGPQTRSTLPPETPPAVTGPVRMTITGSCTSTGGTLTGHSANFTPGRTATIKAWYPNGIAYTDLRATSGVRGDGTIVWSWPCRGDRAGTYTTEVVDQATGRSTGRVGFTIGSPTAQPPPPPVTVTEQSGSHGSPTFTNPANAGGPGPVIPAMSYVEVSCKVHPGTTIVSANPDGYWYRIASPPWSNQYYAVANTFWNGDVPGRTPYTHNTDWAVPDC